ncbi:MAG: helix-turn-helix transcriptional regulator [Maritimibacter sp.]|nr:helix-turn-helix transcriptional regulator [Maritimibacter sp.]
MSLARAREFAVLSLLAAHPAHGYEIAKAVSAGPLAALGLSRAAVYAILDRFRTRGWVAEQAEPGGAYPDRTVLSLTDTGRRGFEDQIATLGTLEMPATIPLVALTMYVDSGGTLPPGVLDRQIAERRAALGAALGAGGKDDAHAHSVTARLWRRVLEAELSVLADLRDRIGG